MTYVLLAAICFLAFERYLNSRDFLDLLEAERRKAREERTLLFTHLKEQSESFRSELAALNQARMEETSILLQRIQAPEQAIVSHVAGQAPPDPLPVRLDNDDEMFAIYQDRIQKLGVMGG